MDYIGKKCPVCDKYFHANEEIVVCPECGTPHHRECYEELGHCVNEGLHAEGYDYNEVNAEEEKKDGVVTCPSCGKENQDAAFFCKYCGSPLSKEDAHNNPGGPQQGYPGSQQGFPGANGNVPPFGYMDPMGGVPGDTDFGDGVTAGETAKYVKQNTPYFMRVFNNIKSFDRSKFNFAAALFSGGYMLYRKMYKAGAFVTALQLAIMLLSTFIRIHYASYFNELYTQYMNMSTTTQLLEYFSKLASSDMFILYLPMILSTIQIVMMIVIGATFNRMYMKHCKKEIIKIKSNATESESADAMLQTKGGVNMPLAISLLVTNLIINYLPGLLSGLL